MDNLLCDELLEDIFTRIPKSSSSWSVSLVSKRWLHLYRTSKTCLSLRLNPDDDTSTIESLLPNYPFLSSLNILLLSPHPTLHFSDHLLFIVTAFCSNLKHLSFLVGPLSPSSLLSLPHKFSHLTSLHILLSRPLFLNWIALFSSLKDLSIRVSDNNYCNGYSSYEQEELDAELGLETLDLSGITRADDSGFGWLWRSCKKLKKLQLESCESIGDDDDLSFIKCLKGIEEIELRSCRSIVGLILLRLAENCDHLKSVLIYDGGSEQGLLHFIRNCRSILQKIDLRLPLDLNNVHLSAIGMNMRGLSSLRLESCCLENGEGLKGLNPGIEQLSLINCDIVARESGLLAGLGQELRGLRKIDLSENELLVDKELISMLVSCSNLVELKLRGCKAVSGMTLVSMLKNCKRLKCVDIINCGGIDFKAIELFILNAPPRFTTFHVDQTKLSHVASTSAANKFIQLFT